MQWLNVTTDFLNYINTLKLKKKVGLHVSGNGF